MCFCSLHGQGGNGRTGPLQGNYTAHVKPQEEAMEWECEDPMR